MGVETPGRHFLGQAIEVPFGPRTLRDPAGEQSLCVLEDLEPGPGDLALPAQARPVEERRMLL